METITINGEEYVKKTSIQEKAECLEGKPYMIIRTHSAGVFAGYVDSRDGQETTIINARRIWKWEGAATLSQLAIDGTSLPNKCKFHASVDKIIVTQTIELLSVTDKAKKSIESVPIWKV